MTEGTRSVLIGCHSSIHSYYVFKAWRRLYGTYPKPWEIICILLHDIGHIGLQYLSDPKAKDNHWRLGARIASLLFGDKGYQLVAGHTEKSGVPQSLLKRADKYSWLIAPEWWLWANFWIEGFTGNPIHWKEQVRKDIERGDWRDNHDAYLDMIHNDGR